MFTKTIFVYGALLCGVIWIGWLALKTPTNDANWQLPVRVLPTVSLTGDVIQINNLRDFRYHSDGRVAEARYRNEEYQLSKFKRAWYGISHFAEHNLAHVFLSFEFDDEKYLVVSIEARLEERHTNGYSPLKGLFRGFHKTVVLATEQDVIGVRSHIRDERVLLYHFDVPELYTKPLLLNFLREAQVLTREPSFYNTLVGNCLTGLLAQSDQFRSVFEWLDWRFIFPGGSDEIAYNLGYVDNSISLEELRARALVDPQGYDANSADFSARIRNLVPE